MFPKKGNSFPVIDASGDYATAVAEALRLELGESHQAVKTIARWTGAHERTAKNWLAGTRGPAGEHLVGLMRRSNAVLSAVLRLSGRHDVAIAFGLVHARDGLAEMLRGIDRLIAPPPGGNEQTPA